MINSVPEELNIRLENYDYQMWDYRQPILQQRSRAGTMPSYTSIYLADNSFQNRFVENKVHQGGLSASSTLRSTGLEGQDSYGYEKQLSRLSRNRSQSVNQVVTCIKNKSLFPPNRPRASSVDDYSVTWNMSSSIHQNYDQKVMYPLFMKDSEFMADVRNRSEYEVD
jgi:hypothetical protein